LLGATLTWTGPNQAWRKSEEGTIAAIALGAPLLLTGLLYGRAELSQGLCALMLGIIAVIYLLVARRARGGLPTLVTAVGCALAVVAIGVGLDGTSRLLALAASTLGVITLAHGVPSRLASPVAAAYWCAIAVLGAANVLLDANALHPIAEAMPLVLAGAIALYAARAHVGAPLGQVYVVLAPVAVGVGVLHTSLTASSATAFMLAWSLAAVLVAHKWRWSQLRLGALATIPAGLWLFLSDPPGVFDLSAWVQREALILAWLGVTATLVRHLGSKPVSASEREADQLLLVAVPTLMTAELARAMGVFDVPMDRLPLLASMVWGLWIAGHGWLGRYRPAPVVAIGLTLGLFVLSTLFTPYGLAAGAASVLVPVLTWMTLKYDARRRVSQLAAGAVLVAFLGAALRYAGGLEGLEANVGSLLFEREVQHWVTALWAAVAVGLIAYASRRRRRGLWGLGTLVTFLLLVKMLLVDIAALGAVAQVGTFMGVGVAFLVLGYFCPRPPAAVEPADEGASQISVKAPGPTTMDTNDGRGPAG